MLTLCHVRDSFPYPFSDIPYPVAGPPWAHCTCLMVVLTHPRIMTPSGNTGPLEGTWWVLGTTLSSGATRGDPIPYRATLEGPTRDRANRHHGRHGPTRAPPPRVHGPHQGAHEKMSSALNSRQRFRILTRCRHAPRKKLPQRGRGACVTRPISPHISLRYLFPLRYEYAHRT